MILGVLGFGRRQALARMTETVVFFTTAHSFDPVTLEDVTVENVIADDVPARVAMTVSSPRDVDAGAQWVGSTRLEVHVPVGSVLVGDGVTVRVKSSTSDPALVGVKYLTKHHPTLGQVTAWRYPVEAVS